MANAVHFYNLAILEINKRIKEINYRFYDKMQHHVAEFNYMSGTINGLIQAQQIIAFLNEDLEKHKIEVSYDNETFVAHNLKDEKSYVLHDRIYIQERYD